MRYEPGRDRERKDAEGGPAVSHDARAYAGIRGGTNGLSRNHRN
jgi:hypothetical protein